MVLWQSSQRPMYVRTVWVGDYRHAILTHDDPYLLKLHAKRRRPNSSASCTTASSRLSQRSDDLQECLRKLNLVLKSDKSRINKRPVTGDIERLNLHGVDQDYDDELIVRASAHTDSNDGNYDSLNINMRNLRANKTARVDAKENTELSERVLQWLDLAGKIDLLAPENVERMSQPRHSWPELQRRNHNLSKSKTAIDLHKEAGRTSPKGGDSPKAQQSGNIDRHEFYVPTSANTIENYARQSRNAKSTPRHETNVKIKDNHNKTRSRELRTNVTETRLKVISEKNAVEKQYAEMLNKKLIPDVSKNPKRQVHIFMPELPKKPEPPAPASRTESLLSQPSYKSLKFDTTAKK
uniref:SFRICE_012579 n=1 Tax=Spodoptera frugiperda TaxID=7108 RepID=A0A2H1VQ25_SPOFR